MEKEEHENIKKWHENQKKLIDEKGILYLKSLKNIGFFLDKAEENKKQELREQAKKELQEWHSVRIARLEQRKKDNSYVF